MSDIRERRFRHGHVQDELWDARRQHASPGKVTLTSRLQMAARAARPRDEAKVQRKVPSVSELEARRAEMARWETAALLGYDPGSGHGGQERFGQQELYGKPVQFKSMSKEHDPASPSSWSGNGQALPEDVRTKMEHAFGADFSAVRIHEGPQATALRALAYTHGTDIHFAPGEYDPSSQRGQKLLGHELTHVVQQSQGRVTATTQAKGVGINDDTSLEREADEQGERAARGEPVAVTTMLRGGSLPAVGAQGERKTVVVPRASAFPCVQRGNHRSRRGGREGRSLSRRSRPRDAPRGTVPINESRLDHDDVERIKKGIQAESADWVGITPDGHVITSDEEGNAEDHGHFQHHLPRILDDSATARRLDRAATGALIGGVAGALIGEIVGGTVGGISGAAGGTVVAPVIGTIVVGGAGVAAGAQAGAAVGAVAGAAVGAVIGWLLD